MKINCYGYTWQVYDLKQDRSNFPKKEGEYPDDMLKTLCDICHERERGREKIEKHLLVTLKMNGFLYDDLLALSSAIDRNFYFKDFILTHLRKFKNK